MSNRVRIVIVGDSGVGKTCLTHLIAHHESLIRPGWTVGCNIQVKIHEFKEGTARQSPYFVELFDVGGSLNHKNTRSVFYAGVHGIILVHDLTNGKSQEHLLEWLYEIVNKEGKDTYKSRGCTTPASSSPPRTTFSSNAPECASSASNSAARFDMEEFLGATQTPILVMGTKLDLIDEKRQPKTAVKKAGGIADKCGAEEIWLNCRDTRSLAAGTTDSVKLSRFFDCVIEKRESLGGGGGSTTPDFASFGIGPPPDRRRPVYSAAASSPDYPPLYGGPSSSNSGSGSGSGMRVLPSAIPLLDTNDLK